MDQRLGLRERYALIDEYGGVLIDTVRATPEECKAAFDALTKAEAERLNSIIPGSGDPLPGIPSTADEWIKQGAMGLVRIHLEAVEGSEYYERMMKQPPPP